MHNTLFPLSHYELIKISGADTLGFLQGQVTCNTELLSVQRSLTGALCNLKGRVIADFRLVQQGEDCLLQCAAGMAQEIVTTLKKYAVFSKVDISQMDAETAARPVVVGLMENAADAALQALDLELPENANAVTPSATCSVVRLSGPTKRIELWFHSGSEFEAFSQAFALEHSNDLEPWLRADIDAGILHVSQAISAEYTPQLLNYDISGLVDFKKGCYTGQEIVARMFYRGTAKKRLHLANCSHAISESSKIVYGSNSDSKEGGSAEILAFSNAGASGAKLLAILPASIEEAAYSLTLSNQPGSVLSIRELPYAAE